MHRVLASLALLASSTFLVSAWAQPNHPPNPPPAPFFENVTIWAPPASWSRHSGSYGRSVLLNKDGEQGIPTILATAAYSPPDGAYFQIFQSTDYGQSWTMISKAHFDGNSSLSGGIILQPFLYELSEAYGKYPAGTVMLAGNRIPGDSSSTNIQMYASMDKGYASAISANPSTCHR
ncbi:Glycoside hydrolase family 93 protein [Mycena venus]|uniref:Glycoside hydrolase family 93 protein n=1 Tax=Mycena venus TaxID=2733690 RepID=A0A8H6WTV0_9AGAR|nr:Glycoside hydrolase family 93 protein [Mycena venus]